MSSLTIILSVVGLVLLLVGAELLVRGASRLATTIGMSPLIVGLIVVSFCTTSPELAVSASSALAGEADLALGNVVGSSIFNILFIVGLSAMIAPLVVKMQLIRLDVPIALAAAAVVWVTAMLAQGGVPVPPEVLRFELPVMIGVIALCIPMFYLAMDVSRAEGAILFGFYLAITSVLILRGINHPWATVAGIVVVVTGMTILAGFFMRAWSHRQGRKQQLHT